jgi:hypothetical protein
MLDAQKSRLDSMLALLERGEQHNHYTYQLLSDFVQSKGPQADPDECGHSYIQMTDGHGNSRVGLKRLIPEPQDRFAYSQHVSIGHTIHGSQHDKSLVESIGKRREAAELTLNKSTPRKKAPLAITSSASEMLTTAEIEAAGGLEVQEDTDDIERFQNFPPTPPHTPDRVTTITNYMVSDVGQLVMVV